MLLPIWTSRSIPVTESWESSFTDGSRVYLTPPTSSPNHGWVSPPTGNTRKPLCRFRWSGPQHAFLAASDRSRTARLASTPSVGSEITQAGHGPGDAIGPIDSADG